ncbi:MAG: GFA family protein [Alphaproteobacteria bacterium]
MTSKINGGCACGAIRYEIAAEPMMAGHCQCRDCQRASGTGHSSIVAFPEPAVTLKGSPKYHNVKADSGATVSRGFCATCGSPVMARTTSMPGVVTIPAGSLDDPARYQPGMVVYTKSAQAWDKMDAALSKFDKLPPMPGR